MVKLVLIKAIKAYRLILSPWLGSSCRFTPSCSVYGMQAIEEHGAAAGTYLCLKRIARCHPWCGGGYDPIPQNFHFFSSWSKRDHVSSSSSESHLP